LLCPSDKRLTLSRYENPSNGDLETPLERLGREFFQLLPHGNSQKLFRTIIPFNYQAFQIGANQSATM
jgi:hypothetical protein